MNSQKLILIFILILASFFRLYMLGDLYSFIGDQGWFYLSARELLNGQIPLVGITSSYTWVHQGALWTYILAPVLHIFNYNPIGGAYLSILLGVLAVFMMYMVGKTLFNSEKVGLVSALFLAASPLAIYFDRMPYHTSPIPLATLIFIFAIYKFATGNKNYLILAFFMLGILYNLALITMIFWILTVIILLKVREFDLKLYLISIFSFLIPMIPMIIYDVKEGTGFYQTTTFPRLIKVSLFDSSGFDPNVYFRVLKKLLEYNQRLIFIANKFIGIIIVIFSGIFILYEFFKSNKKKFDFALFILLLWIGLCFMAILSSKNASEAYLPMLMPGIILLVSYFLIKVTELNKSLKPITYVIIALIFISNVYMIYTTNFLSRVPNFISMNERMNTAEMIVKSTKGSKYNIISKGPGSEFEYNLLNYVYLTWWLGNEPSKNDEKIKYIIEENNGEVYLEEKN